MRTSLIVTFVGSDKPGLVQQIASVISAQDGNWLESRMTQLGGKFAGIVRVSVDSTQCDALNESLFALSNDSLTIFTESGEADSTEPRPQRLKLQVLGPDRPGIIYEVSYALAELSINVIDMYSNAFPASMTGEYMFEAEATAECAADLIEAHLGETLDALSQDLGIDIDFEMMPGAQP